MNNAEYSAYFGQLKEGRRHGWGILVNKKSKFENDLKEFGEGYFELMDVLPGDVTYVYRGTWKEGCREGFGIEMLTPDRYFKDKEYVAVYQRKYDAQNYKSSDAAPYNEEATFIVTKYTGFFNDNRRQGEGVVELRDENNDLHGFYLGRYENGARHGIGQRVLINHDALRPHEKYEITPQLYNDGFLVKSFERQKFLSEDILINVDYFGFLGVVESLRNEKEDDAGLNGPRDITVSDF